MGTAVGLVAGLGSLEDIYANLDKVKEQAFLSKELATIKCDVELEFGLSDVKSSATDKDTLLDLFRHMEFKAWIAELSGDAPAGNSNKSSSVANDGSVPGADIELPPAFDGEVEYAIVYEQADLDAWLEKLKAAELFAFDTETTSLNYKEARIVGLSFSVEAGKAAYVPLAHEDVLAQLKPILESTEHKKVGQHMKYDMHVLANHGIYMRGVQYDTMLESYILDSVATRHDMDSLSLKYLGHKTISFEEIAGKGAKQLTFNQIAIDTAGPYAAEDADITLRLHQHLWPQLEKVGRLKDVFENIEMPVMPVLFEMEENGALIDADKLHEQSQQIDVRLQELEQEAHN